MTEIMTLVAHAWARYSQGELIDRAMRFMAVQTVLAHRQMLEQERSALLGMTLVASRVDRFSFQQRLGDAAVRVMTIRTRDFAFAYRHV